MRRADSRCFHSQKEKQKIKSRIIGHAENIDDAAAIKQKNIQNTLGIGEKSAVEGIIM